MSSIAETALSTEAAKRIIPSLMFQSTKKVFDFKSDPQQREKLKKQLEDSNFRVGAFEFNGQAFEDIDLSKFNLLGLDFSGCTFNKTNLSKTNFRDVRLCGTVLNNVNLRNADLRMTFSDPNYFKGCILNNVDLNGALLYGDTSEEY